MDIIYAQGKAGVADVMAALPDPPTYSSVRALLRILEEKGHLTHQEAGRQYVYRPTQPRQQAAQSALSRVVQTFFGGSVERAVTALVSAQEVNLTESEIVRLEALIAQAREKRQ